MGRDVHAHIEQKIDGRWEHYDKLLMRRDYQFFDFLEVTCGQWRGVPDDISLQTRLDMEHRWGADGHSHSWLSGAELEDAADYLRINGKSQLICELGWFYGNGFLKDDSWPPCVTEVRMVFWFDN